MLDTPRRICTLVKYNREQVDAKALLSPFGDLALCWSKIDFLGQLGKYKTENDEIYCSR